MKIETTISESDCRQTKIKKLFVNFLCLLTFFVLPPLLFASFSYFIVHTFIAEGIHQFTLSWGYGCLIVSVIVEYAEFWRVLACSLVIWLLLFGMMQIRFSGEISKK